MSADIKPGQVWAWQDTADARGYPGAQFEIADAAPHAPDVAYRYPHAAGFNPDQTYGAPAAVIAANAVLVPSPEVIEAVNVLRDAGIRSAEDFDRLVAAHAPEPEWLEGDVAEISVRGCHAAPLATMRAIRRDGGWRTSGGNWDDVNVEVVTPLVVIDPAAVDVDTLVAAAHTDSVLYGDTTPDQMRAAALRMLAVLRIEVAR